MNVELRSIADKGNLEKERLTLRVLADVNIGEYLLIRAIHSGGSLTNGVKDCYWFPDKLVDKGDLIVLYTKAGTQSSRELEGGNTAHFFYLSLERPIWNSAGIAAVLMHGQNWEAKTPKEL